MNDDTWKGVKIFVSFAPPPRSIKRKLNCYSCCQQFSSTYFCFEIKQSINDGLSRHSENFSAPFLFEIKELNTTLMSQLQPKFEKIIIEVSSWPLGRPPVPDLLPLPPQQYPLCVFYDRVSHSYSSMGMRALLKVCTLFIIPNRLYSTISCHLISFSNLCFSSCKRNEGYACTFSSLLFHFCSLLL